MIAIVYDHFKKVIRTVWYKWIVGVRRISSGNWTKGSNIPVTNTFEIGIGEVLVTIQPVSFMKQVGYIPVIFGNIKILVAITFIIITNFRKPFINSRRIIRISNTALCRN